MDNVGRQQVLLGFAYFCASLTLGGALYALGSDGSAVPGAEGYVEAMLRSLSAALSLLVLVSVFAGGGKVGRHHLALIVLYAIALMLWAASDVQTVRDAVGSSVEF